MQKKLAILAVITMLSVLPAVGGNFNFSTGLADGRMGMASQPGGGGNIEIEAADDFLLTSATSIDHATFTGLLPSGLPLSGINQVVIEIYRVFPKDSTTPPSGNVLTRVNSPSDVAFDSRDSAVATLSFTATDLGLFSVGNTVVNGINPKPNQMTGGEGAASGEEVEFDVSFSTPFLLPADHYFFVPQVELSNGTFLWLSAPKPIVAPGTPFTPDLQAWIRNANLAPDWSRVGTDIVGPPATGGPAPTFNGVFSLSGTAVPEPATLLLLGTGIVPLLRRRKK